MKVKFYLENKISKSGEQAIWCYVREFDETIALNTKERIKAKLWDKEVGRANIRNIRDKLVRNALISLNQYLNIYENEIYELTRAVRSKNVGAGFDAIAKEIKSKFNNREISIYEVYDEYIDIKRIEVSKASNQKIKRIKGLLQEFEKKSREKLDFEKITPLFFTKFNSFLIEQKNMINNTAAKNIQFLKTFLIWANNNNYINNMSYKSFKTKWEKNEVIYLTEKELMHLYNMKIADERLKRVRDLFVFQCFTGVRYSDIENISRDDISNATWTVRTQKTHQIIEIPLSSYPISILAKYGDYPQPLPVISNQKMNMYLKELLEIAGINEPVKVVKYKGSERIETTYKKFEVVGTHTARRTFISLSLQKGMKPDVIMAITGHTTYRMMQKYLKIADEHKREEMDKVWGNSLRVIEKTK